MSQILQCRKFSKSKSGARKFSQCRSVGAAQPVNRWQRARLFDGLRDILFGGRLETLVAGAQIFRPGHALVDFAGGLGFLPFGAAFLLPLAGTPSDRRSSAFSPWLACPVRAAQFARRRSYTIAGSGAAISAAANTAAKMVLIIRSPHSVFRGGGAAGKTGSRNPIARITSLSCIRPGVVQGGGGARRLRFAAAGPRSGGVCRQGVSKHGARNGETGWQIQARQGESQEQDRHEQDRQEHDRQEQKASVAKPKKPKPIELYYWPTPNGFKISIMLEECKLPYTLIPVNISKGEQFKPEFLKISPNNRMPAIVDPARAGRAADLDLRVRRHPAISRAQDRQVLSERGARARRGRAVAVLADGRARPDGRPAQPLQALRQGEPDLRDHALRGRGQPALRRDEHAAEGSREFLAGKYSIADMACVGWVNLWERQGQDIDEFPHLKRWLETVKARPAVQRGMALGRRAAQGHRYEGSESAGGAVRPARATA